MTQQEIHPTTTKVEPSSEPSRTTEPTAPQTAAQTPRQPDPQWYGDPAPWRGPSQGQDPFAAEATHGSTQGATQVSAPESGNERAPGSAQPTTEVPGAFQHEPVRQGPGGGDGGWGGPQPPLTPPPARAPRGRRGRRIAELSTVAVLAAVLASGGTFTATKFMDAGSTTATSGSSSSGASINSGVSSGSNPAAPVIQTNGASPDWTATAKAVAPSVVSITVASGQAQGQGSGVVIDKGGHILTNNHVATGAGAGATISVTLSDGRTYDAKIVGTDPSTDLAVLALANPPSDLTPISFGDSAKLAVGQPVMAVGNPLGLAGTVTTGIVSALNRPVTTSDPAAAKGAGDPVVTNAVQTSAAINPGNSGGALVTADGQLIGINSSIASLGSSGSSQSGNIGIGFAIPVNEAKSIADQLIATGSAQHAFLGVSSSDTTVTENGSKRDAALVRVVTAGTPAATAGLKVDDAVVAVNGQPIASSKALVAAIHERKVGDTVTVTVLRGGARTDVKVTLIARPGQG